MDHKALILFIDDHKAIANGCRAEFEDAGLPWEVVWFGSAHDIVWPESDFLVVLDLRLNDGTRPIQVIREIEKRGAPVVVYTSGEQPNLVREAITSKAVMGIVNKAAPTQELIDAIQAALEGKHTGSLDWAHVLDLEEDFAQAHLTPRERTILTLYASGMSAKQVATRIGLKLATVNTYVARIKTKYRVIGRLPRGTRPDLYREALQDGLIDPEDTYKLAAWDDEIDTDDEDPADE